MSTDNINDVDRSVDADNTWEEDVNTKATRSTWCSNHTGRQKASEMDEEMGDIGQLAKPQPVLGKQPSQITEHAGPCS